MTDKPTTTGELARCYKCGEQKVLVPGGWCADCFEWKMGYPWAIQEQADTQAAALAEQQAALQKAHAVNLGLVGALERDCLAWGVCEVDALEAPLEHAMERASKALTSEGMAPYRELMEALPAILRKLEIIQWTHKDEKETRDVLIPAVRAVLNHGDTGEER